ncbi:SSU-rRNA maturation protein Tsr4-like protein 1 Tsr401 [Schizosaccharomyces osmophilus]|uniref:SSU-rRNA maturation protein Tsr4-like protein 1 Tsr401 n=1 Tax=Schizosaccharomyces osmophilus TaxID=2545709 RepID=A0AAF0AUN6_9SCHI|nr:SSU-rRNA maturation protein Tsr4-like protein 1 Tsr401 [Schizosaccharomyces osmophilus]WBW71792.1 SSU-rRNA maturation protein Tsr4-like protein 1 Tsr401 [Schizosaccharomyces osmophilus]
MNRNWLTTKVWLGTPDVNVSDQETPDQYSTFLGDSPVFLENVSVNPDDIRCGNCNSYCRFLLQCYAPIEGDESKERALYIWACHDQACRRSSKSVICLRGVQVVQYSKQETEPPKKAPAEEVSKPTKINPFTSSSSSTTKASNPFSSSFSSPNPFALSSQPSSPCPDPPKDEKHLIKTQNSFAAMALTGANKNPETKNSSSDKVYVDAQNMPIHPQVTTTYDYPMIPKFPGMFLTLDSEYLPKSLKAKEMKKGSSSLKIQETMDSYGNWDNESYEKSPAVYEKAFRNFTDLISHNPTQCVRYERGGKPLLSSSRDTVGKMFNNADPYTNTLPVCSLCKSPRIFEMQLMPYSISVLDDEVAEWSTILVATCSVDCRPPLNKYQVGYAKEWVGIQWE